MSTRLHVRTEQRLRRTVDEAHVIRTINDQHAGLHTLNDVIVHLRKVGKVNRRTLRHVFTDAQALPRQMCERRGGKKRETQHATVGVIRRGHPGAGRKHHLLHQHRQ